MAHILLCPIVQNVKVLPQARGNQAMSAFVDFAEVADAKRAFEAELVIGGQRLRSDYNIRRGERREFSDRGGGDRGGERRDSWGSNRDSNRQSGGGVGMYDDKRAHSSRGDIESHRSSNRRERSRSPVRRDRSRERRGSGGSGSGGGGDDRYQQRRDYRSPPRSGGGDRDRDFGRNDDYHQSLQRERQPRSPPRSNGHAMDPHARMNGNDSSYANGSRSGGSDRNRY